MTGIPNRTLPPGGGAILPERVGIGARLRRQVSTFVRRSASRSAHRRAETHLLGLPDLMLKDIGIDRSEIESVVRRGDHDATRRSRQPDLARYG